MSCNNDTPSPTVLDIQYFTSSNCFDCGGECGGSIYNSKCIIYTGPNLGCSGVNTNDSLETALQKIDAQICSIIGDYSTYTMHCLPTWYGQTIDTQAKFVDAITGMACETASTVSTFVNTTFPTYQDTINDRFIQIEVPGITCSLAGVVNTDYLQDVLNKYCTLFTTINNKFNISSVVWDNCYTVISNPTTLPTAFQLLADQICDTKALISSYVLPTFNNVDTCLSGGGSSDSLVTTIGLIKTRLCLTPTYNINSLDWGCLTKPSSSQTDLQSAFQTVLDTLSDYLINKLTSYSGDFVITQTDSGNVCSGLSIALATPLNLDRYVAATASDSSPGTLQDKLVAGTNLTLDYSNPDQVTINATSNDTYKVKAHTGESDGDAGYLDTKIEGNTANGITLSTTYNSGDKKVQITPSVDMVTLFQNLYDYVNTDTTAQSLWCILSSKCPLGGYVTFNISHTNGMAVTSGGVNNVTIFDFTNPGSPTLVFTSPGLTGTSTSQSSSCILPSGKAYKVIVNGVANNTDTQLSIEDATLGLTLTSPSPQNQSISVENSYTIALAANGHTYSVIAQTWSP